jgi:Flp pilus assembly protein TadB
MDVPSPSNKNQAKELIKKFESKMEREFFNEMPQDYSKEYEQFRRETLKNLSWYEKACKNVGRSFKVKLKKKDEEKLQKDVEISHLDIKPNEASGFAWFTLLASLFLTFLISVAIFLVSNQLGSEIFIIFFLLVGVSFFLFYYVNTLPSRIAQKWKLKASSQMIPCILYIVVYMRHTSNLERAVRFASQHLQPPLALDLKKIFWNVETSKYSTIKDALDAYLDGWRQDASEFVESFHMIESSLYEPVEERRIETLDKALQIILDGVYEKMLHFTHDVKSPITNIYMLGIVLPTLGLALLPLAATLLQGAIKWYHIIILFNLLIPFFIFYMTNNVLAKRPGGFGETELLERNKEYKHYTDKSHYYKAAFVALPFFILGILPFLFQFGLADLLGLKKDYTFSELGLGFLGSQNIFDFKTTATGQVVGPFGVTALLLSLLVPLSIAIFFIVSYKLKTERLIKTREQTKKLENEFSGSIFQLGNRLADGVPAEMAFGRVAESSKGSPSAGFFSLVNSNIQQAGMSVEEAIFNSSRGAINYYPSELLKTSMQILVEAVKKGLNIAAKALMSISSYIKNIHTVNERLKDLLADITSSMKSNMTFLAPLLAAIIVGLSSMITQILGKLKIIVDSAGGGDTQVLGGSINLILDMFDISKMIPPYWLQVAVGIYIVEVIFVLTITLVTIEYGEDRLGEKFEISKNLSSGVMLYFITALIAIIALSLLASVAISGIAPT